jgi:hypothetical protein
MASPNNPILEPPPTPERTVVVTEEPRGYIKCDFCECKLTRTGEVIGMSEKARELRDEKERYDRRIAELERQLTEAKSDLNSCQVQLEQAQGSRTVPGTTSPATRRGFLRNLG